MNVHNQSPNWRTTKHEQKIDLIVQAYEAGNTNSVSIASWLSEYFTYPLTGDHVRELYSRNRNRGGKLVDHPLQPVPSKCYPRKMVQQAADLWNSGLDAYLVGEVMGITRDKVYDIIGSNRSMFERRHGNPNVDAAKSHPDRVTRFVNGWPVTLKRVTFIDGAAQ